VALPEPPLWGDPFTMKMRPDPLDSDVPYYPFPLRLCDDGIHYLANNHLISEPVRLNKQAAEVLRLANGENTLAALVSYLVERYPDGGGTQAVRVGVIDTLRTLSANELVWWRDVPVEPVPVEPPPSVFWEITAACNLRCRHCVVGAGTKLDGELTTERCLELASELASCGVGDVAFSGGEPLLRPDFRLIAERVSEHGMTFQVATNGTLVTPEIARWLKQMKSGVQVSLDGSNPEIHDWLRPGHEAFNRTVSGIRNLVEAGHPVMVGTVLSTRNIDDIPATLALCEDLGVSAFRLIPFVPKGRGGVFSDLEVAPSGVKRITQYLRSQRERTKLEITSLEFEDMLDGTACADPADESRGLGCSGAVAYATITPNGELLPCHFFEGVRADSVANAPFWDVWCRSRFLNYFRHLGVRDLHGACSECSWLPRCGGSCRAINYSKGDLFGPNRACWIALEIGTPNT